MNKLIEVFPPGEFIREELEAREWTQGDLADIMGRPTETVNRLIAGKLAITPETAKGLGAAFGTSADYWLNLETTYQLSQVSSDSDISRRARLYEIAPISELVKRRWIEPTNSVDVLESQVLDFYELKSIQDAPTMAAAARKSTDYGATNSAQLAWYCFAKKLAKQIEAPAFGKSKMEKLIPQLKALTGHPQEVRHVPRILNDAGIRFVVVRHLSKSKIDGAAFWLDKARKQPVVALSMRYDRIDSFWHTLTHEIAHIWYGDDVSIDSDMVGETAAASKSKPDYEQRADKFATAMLVDTAELEDFINRVRPLYAKKKIEGFANRIGVHPGIVVGQLQHLEEISFSHSREMLVKVRDVLTSASHTDGWN
jgi:HTH-type transcriptional regulator/antitoxin HigA